MNRNKLSTMRARSPVLGMRCGEEISSKRAGFLKPLGLSVKSIRSLFKTIGFPRMENPPLFDPGDQFLCLML